MFFISHLVLASSTNLCLNGVSCFLGFVTHLFLFVERAQDHKIIGHVFMGVSGCFVLVGLRALCLLSHFQVEHWEDTEMKSLSKNDLREL